MTRYSIRPVTNHTLILLFCSILLLTASNAIAQPSGWPGAWIFSMSDPDENGTSNDQRDVQAIYYAVEGGYLFLRMQNQSNAGWGEHEHGRYKWFLDTIGGDAHLIGGNFHAAEFALLLEDHITFDPLDPLGYKHEHDFLGEMTIVDDLPPNDPSQFDSRWGGGNEPHPYFTNTPVGDPSPSPYWRRVFDTTTPLFPNYGAPQGTIAHNIIGYRVIGQHVDMYVKLSHIGDPNSVCAYWATDQENQNIDQAPHQDRPSSDVCFDIPLKGNIVINKHVEPATAPSTTFSFTGDLGNFDLTASGASSAGSSFANLDPGTYTVEEVLASLPGGWSLGSIVCDDPTLNSAVNVATGTATINLAPGETVECNYTNVEPPPPPTGTIVIVKHSLPHDPQVFDYVSDIPGGANFQLSDTGVNHTITFSDILLGGGSQTFTVTEEPGGLPAGWDLSSLSCEDPTPAGTGTNPLNRTATINLTDGDVVVCTFVNTKRGSITIVKNTVPDGPQNFSFSGSLGDFSLDDDGDPALANSITFNDLHAGSYTVTEANPAPWKLQQIACTESDNNSSINLATGSASLVLDPGENIVCTFTNVEPATLTIIKDADPADGTNFAFNIGGTAYTLDDAVPDDGDGVSNSVTLTGLSANTVDVSELIPGDWTLTGINCQTADPVDTSTVNLANGSVAVDVDAGENISCTFSNQIKRGSITIVKDAQPNGSQVFGFSGDLGAFNLDDNNDGALPNTRVFDSLLPGSYNVREIVPDRWNLADINCRDADGGTLVDLNTGSVSIDLDPGENITCRFINVEAPVNESGILIIKHAEPHGDQVFEFTGTGGNGLPANFTLVDNGVEPNSLSWTVADATYTVTEAAVPGWDLTDMRCSDPTGDSHVDLAQRTATIEVGEGELVVCTFVNTQRGTIVLRKDAIPNDSQNFRLIHPGLGGGSSILDDSSPDDGDPYGNSVTFSDVPPGGYSVTEAPLVHWALVDIRCNDPDRETRVNSSTGTANIDLDPGETVSCVFVNSLREEVHGPVHRIPTMSAWGLLLLSVGLAGVAVYTRRRRTREPHA